MKYQICVSGAASGDTVTASHQLAYDLGKAIASRGKTLLTGATVGLPHFAAMGAKSVKTSGRGISVGFSPASSFREHVATYKLPTVEFDYINFTGMEYVGRDVHLVRSSDAVVTVGGRMGSLHELSTALESRKVCGVLLGSGGLADYVSTLLENIEAPGARDVIYDTDPDRLVERVVEALDRKYADFQHDGTDSQVSAKRSGRG
ncbi:LOG family protein [Candidatus Saccharibacteria bacterium]|nr:LOG family protein [Candidatus Saccharibacteria bacterium]